MVGENSEGAVDRKMASIARAAIAERLRQDAETLRLRCVELNVAELLQEVHAVPGRRRSAGRYLSSGSPDQRAKIVASHARRPQCRALASCGGISPSAWSAKSDGSNMRCARSPVAPKSKGCSAVSVIAYNPWGEVT